MRNGNIYLTSGSSLATEGAFHLSRFTEKSSSYICVGQIKAEERLIVLSKRKQIKTNYIKIFARSDIRTYDPFCGIQYKQYNREWKMKKTYSEGGRRGL
jgi:hypothetical protein